MSARTWLRAVRQWLAGHRESIALGLTLLLIPLIVATLGCNDAFIACHDAVSRATGYYNPGNSVEYLRYSVGATKVPQLALGRPAGLPGLEFAGKAPGPPFPPAAKLIWHPPPDLKWVRFDPYNPPAAGGPPYVWNLPVDEVGNVGPVHVEFEIDPSSSDRCTKVALEAGGQTVQRTAYVPKESWEPLRPPGLTELAARTDYWRWAVKQDVGLGRFEMSKTTCGFWLDFVRGRRFFYALRYPAAPVAIEPPPEDPQAHWYLILPGVMDSSSTPELWLEGYAPHPVGRYGPLPLEIKPEYLDFCFEALPTAPGEGWVTFGPVADADVQCPDEFVGDDWGLALKMDLDFGGQKDAMVNETLVWYVCYQEPGLAASPARALAGAVGAQLYAAWDTVCLGPLPLPLLDEVRPEPPFSLEGVRAFGHVTPTQAISLAFACANLSTQPVDLKIEIASERGLTWDAKMGTHSAPFAPPQPLPETLRLGPKGTGRQFIWFTADVPADAAWGGETLTITATDVQNPTRSTWNTGLVWVGEWPPGEPRRHIYLPITLRR